MASPKRRQNRLASPPLKNLPRRLLALAPAVVGALLGAVLTLALLLTTTTLSLPPPPKNRLRLFIAIGSAPRNTALRSAARDGYLRWLPPDASVAYKFFSDARPAPGRPTWNADGDESSAAERKATWDVLEAEAAARGDVVLQDIATGYGSPSANAYGRRARFQLAYVRASYAVDYYLRIDDDSFLCLHRLLYELASAPASQFFWGRYWCREGRNRADENFMLFSGDVAALLGEEEYVGRILPFDDGVTLGWNFGYWAWVLNLTVFDDQLRIDAQQGYLTEYMHGAEAAPEDLAQFCDRFIYAHHVQAPVALAAFQHTSTRLMYSVPQRTTSRETCKAGALSFLPARHSSKLPNVRVSLPD